MQSKSSKTCYIKSRMIAYKSRMHFFKVRKSFFKDINIHNNEALVDVLYQQFYSGSKIPPTPESLETIRRLFTSEPYVKSEYRYHRITNKGNVDQAQLHDNWTSYLEEFQVKYRSHYFLCINLLYYNAYYLILLYH